MKLKMNQIKLKIERKNQKKRFKTCKKSKYMILSNMKQ